MYKYIVGLKMEMIDIVYLWVDGSDPNWVQKKQKYLDKNNKKLEMHATVNGRFRNSDEIIYSIRSIEQFFPEHGNIYIVTDNQKHPLLNEKNVVYIDLTDIMEDAHLPTFSSKKIEINLHKIPNLSDNFLYFNDDVLLGPAFNIDHFIKDNMYFIQYENKNEKDLELIIIPEILPNSYNVLFTKYGVNAEKACKKVIHHNPKIINKKLFLKFQNEFQLIFEEAQKEIFREADVPRLLSDTYCRWLYINNLAIEKNTEYIFVYNKNRKNDFKPLLDNFHKLSYFSVNDVTDNDIDINEPIELTKNILSYLFPDKSRFELTNI